LRKQFDPDVRRRNLRAVRIGVAPKARSLALLEELLCETCEASLPSVRLDASRERDAELRRRAQLSHRYHAKTEVERGESFERVRQESDS
jgi:hypothetical protein